MASKTRTVFNVISKILMWVVIALTVAMMIFTIISVTTLDRSERGIFGYKFLIVQSDSMSESDKNADLDIHFNAGDIIIVKSVADATALQPGDVISFLSTNSTSYGETITHMIRSVKTDSNGKMIGYVTYGTNTGVDDEAVVEPMYVIGKYTGKIPNAGYFFAFLKTTPGYLVCVLIPFSLLIIYNFGNIVGIVKKYRKEQADALKAEHDKIAEERQQNERMLQELQELKAQLEKQRESLSNTEEKKESEEISKSAEDADNQEISESQDKSQVE